MHAKHNAGESESLRACATVAHRSLRSLCSAQAGRNFTAAETALSTQMSLYWSNFAKSGDPNKGLSVAPVWPSMTPGTRETMVFSTTAGGVTEDYHAAQCDYLDTVRFTTRGDETAAAAAGPAAASVAKIEAHLARVCFRALVLCVQLGYEH